MMITETMSPPDRAAAATQPTPAQIRLVQESWAQILPMRTQAATLFYHELFDVDPSLRRLFAHADMQAQGAKLTAALGMVVGALQHPDSVLASAAELGRRHVAYGVVEAHYETVGEALIRTLAGAFGEAFTPDLRDAWAAAYGLVSRTMIDAARLA